MANVFIEAWPKGDEGDPIIHFVVEDGADRQLVRFSTRGEAIDWARRQHHHALVARARHRSNKRIPDHWRSAD